MEAGSLKSHSALSSSGSSHTNLLSCVTLCTVRKHNYFKLQLAVCNLPVSKLRYNSAFTFVSVMLMGALYGGVFLRLASCALTWRATHSCDVFPVIYPPSPIIQNRIIFLSMLLGYQYFWFAYFLCN